MTTGQHPQRREGDAERLAEIAERLTAISQTPDVPADASDALRAALDACWTYLCNLHVVHRFVEVEPGVWGCPDGDAEHAEHVEPLVEKLGDEDRRTYDRVSARWFE